MDEKKSHITRKVVWGYLLLLLIAVCSVSYIYNVIQQLAVEEAPDTTVRQKAYLVTNTLSLLYESEALGQLVGRPENDLRNFNRTMRKAQANLDSLRVLLSDSVQQLKVDTIQDLLRQKRWNTLSLLETLTEWNAGRLYRENIERVIAVQDSIVQQVRDTIAQPTVREIVEVKQDTVIIPKKKKGFFRRLAEAFSSKHEDHPQEEKRILPPVGRSLLVETRRGHEFRTQDHAPTGHRYDTRRLQSIGHHRASLAQPARYRGRPKQATGRRPLATSRQLALQQLYRVE